MHQYQLKARTDAMDAVEYFMDEVVEHLVNNGQGSIHPLNDIRGFDEYHHETHVDAEYSLSESATLLDQLDHYEETDSGLWEGLEPRRAISAQAAYTFGNAVLSMVDDLLKEVQDDDTIGGLLERLDDLDDEDEEDECTRENLIKSLKDRVGEIARGEG